MRATVKPEQEAAWRCYRCGSKRSIGYGMWPNSGPVKAQCVPCGAVSDWPDVPETAMTADPIDRAAEAIANEVPFLSLSVRRRVAHALDNAGLLATPEHDAVTLRRDDVEVVLDHYRHLRNDKARATQHRVRVALGWDQ